MEEVVDTRAEPAIIWHVIVVDDSTAQQPWPEIAQEEEASGDGWCSP